jgi:peptidoglycan/xylan/chitin deacetylase (PgdA/CDA1 family)
LQARPKQSSQPRSKSSGIVGPSPSIKARVSNRLARHLHAAPLRLTGTGPMVSFTFDDVPDSAAGIGAPMLEDHGGRATFYISGGLVGRWSGHWNGIAREDIVTLHRAGHEIACHTFSHRQASELDAFAMAEEVDQNRGYFAELDPTIRLKNFAYPYGLASVSRKGQLKDVFHSARGILPGVNRDVIDLQLLRAMPLIEPHIDGAGIESAFDEATRTNGWLIFYGHDVAEKPSPYGCTPQLLRRALKAASRRNMPIVTVADALRRAGAKGPSA